MATVIDSSIWVDCLRTRSSDALRRQTKSILEGHECVVVEPIIFELLRAVPRRDRVKTEALLATFPILATPSELWRDAQLLGQKCVDRGFLPPAMDLLIAQVCLHHKLPLMTFDRHFQEIAEVSSFKVDLLQRSE
jgi:predicted nucleic acid-binding protein